VPVSGSGEGGAGNARELEPADRRRGVRGFKCFLWSGVAIPAGQRGDLRLALPILARRGVTLLVHAEDPRV